MKPNLFIPGAGRAGTTAISSLLSLHPEISFSWAKEPSYFDRNYDLGSNWYEELFQDCDTRYIGEASTNYLWYEEAPSRIFDYNSQSKLIISLRNPVHRAFSEFTRRIQRRGETRSFNEVLLKTNFLTKRSTYGVPIARYLSIFDRKDIHFMLFERFKEDPMNEIKKVYEFLGLPTNVNIEDAKFNKNESKMPLSRNIQKLRNFVGSDLRDPRSIWYVKAICRRVLDRTNGSWGARSLPRMTEDEAKMAYDIFRKEWEEVESLTGLKVSDDWARYE